VHKYLVVVAGPTAVGKTEAAIFLAQRLGCEVISADSRQFYRDMHIGTAKPDAQQRAQVRHHFVDFLDIGVMFSAGRFEMAVLELLQDLYTSTDVALMVGGSGLYIQAVCEGMNAMPDIPAAFRDALYREYAAGGIAPLVEELKAKDPGYAERVDLKNQQRVIRALEVCRATGRPYSAFRTDRQVQRQFTCLKIGLERPVEELRQRIDRRMDRMIEEGLFEEAASLYDMRHCNALKTVGYREVFGNIDGKYDRDEAVRLLKRNSWRYAKRQLTWFKKDAEMVWFHPEDRDGILKYIQNAIKQ
jgi:tRNA dimethylallyltransferase